MTQFGRKLYAFKSSRMTGNEDDPVLNFERLAENSENNVDTIFLTDNNLMIEVDRACEPEWPATDATLSELKLLEWVDFMRHCDRNNLQYSLTPFFAYAEMPAQLAQLRASRLYKFAEKFGLQWRDDELAPDLSDLGRIDVSFDSLDVNQQIMMSLSFSVLLLMLIIKRDGTEFSPIGRFQRFLREYRRMIGTVSLREIAIARYVFSTPAECPGPLDSVRSAVERNFARKSDRHPRTTDEMLAVALNGAFDLLLFNAMNIAETKGVDGRKVDCWLFSMDGKLKAYNDLCFNASMGTGEAGLFTVITTHEDVSEYWEKTAMLLQKVGMEGTKRALSRMVERINGIENHEVILERLAALPNKARAVIEMARNGL